MTYCERHPNEQAILTCGNCGKQICTICMTLIGEGVRCQDCMARLNAAYEDYLKSDEYLKANAENAPAAKSSIYSPPITPKAEKPRPQVDANGRIIERDTGFRTYWKHTTPRYFIEPRHYLLAALAALVSASVVGVVWGWLIKLPFGNIYPQLGASGYVNSDAVKQFVVASISAAYRNSIHLLPEMLTGVIVAEAIVRVTHDRRGRNLQIIAGVGVLFAYLVVLATLIAKSYANLGLGFPAFGTLTSDTWLVINDMFKSGLVVFVFWVIGIVIVVVRLKP